LEAYLSVLSIAGFIQISHPARAKHPVSKFHPKTGSILTKSVTITSLVLAKRMFTLAAARICNVTDDKLLEVAVLLEL
jgi:hypothetical protein